MSDFDIQIKVDPGAALPTIKAVGAELAKVEAQGPKVGDALSKGMREGSSAAEKLKTSTESVTDSFKREADMLEKINGPARILAENTRTLEALHAKGAITAEQYITQLEKMGHVIEKAGAGTEKASAMIGLPEVPKGPGLADQGISKLGGLAMGVGIGEVVSKVGELAEQYTELSNRARKFADSGHSVNQIISEQTQLAGELHGSMTATMEIYDAVRDGTDDLNLSHKAQIDITRTLGEAVQVAGGSMESAGGIMRTLSFAMASGTISGREMKGMMKEVPDLADLWTEHFHTTRKGLIEMANNGKLAVSELIESLREGNSVHEKFANLTETSAQKWQHFKDVWLVQGVGGSIEDLGALRERIMALEHPTELATEKIGQLTTKLHWMANPIYQAQQNLKALAEEMNKEPDGLYKSFTKLAGGMDKVQLVLGKMAVHGIGGNDPWNPTKLDDKMKALEGLHKEMSVEEQLYESIRGGANKAGKQMIALTDLWVDGRISAQEYRLELEKLAKVIDPNTTFFDPKSITGGKLQAIGGDMGDLSALIPKAGPDAKKAKQEADEIARINTVKWKAEIEGFQKHEAEMTAALKPLEDGILSMVNGGKEDFDQMIDSWVKSLESAALHKGIEGLAGLLTSALFGGGGGGSPLDIITNGQHTGVPLYGGAHADGGSYTAPSYGTTDSHLVMSRMSPGETAYYVPKGQTLQGGQGSSGRGGGTKVQVIVQDDPRALLQTLNSRDGERVHARLNRRQRR